jgi:hypothetical protein
MNIGFALVPNQIFIEKLIQFQRIINQKYDLKLTFDRNKFAA